MDSYYAGLEILRIALLLAGSAVIFIGILRAAFETLRNESGRMIAQGIVSHIALGLEFFIGATLLNLMLNPTWPAVQTTALTIVARKLVTLSLNRLARSST